MWTKPSTPLGNSTNKPNSVIFLIVPSITSPTEWDSANSFQGFGVVCLIPNEILWCSESISRTITSTSCPTDKTFAGDKLFLNQDISDTWTKPSMPLSISTNTPYWAIVVTLPFVILPIGYFVVIVSQGFSCNCFIPNETFLVSGSYLITWTFIFSPTFNTSLGCLTLHQEISVKCNKPSKLPKSMNAP